MARTAEVITIQTLESILATGQAEFSKAAKGKEIANKVKDVPDAYKTLLESAEAHEAEAYKALRRITVKVTAALADASTTPAEAKKLVDIARTLKLFPDEPAKATETTKK